MHIFSFPNSRVQHPNPLENVFIRLAFLALPQVLLNDVIPLVITATGVGGKKRKRNVKVYDAFFQNSFKLLLKLISF